MVYIAEFQEYTLHRVKVEHIFQNIYLFSILDSISFTFMGYQEQGAAIIIMSLIALSIPKNMFSYFWTSLFFILTFLMCLYLTLLKNI